VPTLGAEPAEIAAQQGATRLAADAAARAPSTRALGRALRAPARTLPRLAKQGLVLSFGLATGVVGYWMGRDDARSAARAASAAPPQSPAAALAQHTADASVSAALESTPAETSSADAGAKAALPQTSTQRVRSPRRTTPSRKEVANGNPAASLALQTAESRSQGRATAEPTAEPRVTPEGIDLSEALELLRHAEAALRRSDGLAAMMWLSELERRAPAVLLEERLVTKALAACELDDAPLAAATARALERANPASIYRSRLEGSCVAR
jgi:hypothetical protein